MNTVSLTIEQLDTAKYNDLVKHAVSLGINTFQIKKDELISQLRQHLQSAGTVDEAVKTRRKEVEITEEMRAVLDSDVSKSNKMRQLHTLGMPIAQITRELDTYYSFVMGAISRTPKTKKETVEEAK